MSQKAEAESVKELNKLLKYASERKKRSVNKWLDMANEEGLSPEQRAEYRAWAKKELLQTRDWRLIIFAMGSSAALTLMWVYLALYLGYLTSLLIGHGIPF